MIAMTSAETTMKIAFQPKKLNNKMVIGRLAQGDAKRNATTELVLAPFLYNSMAIARIPWEHALMKNPKTTE